ncbi:G-protein coupled receptor GRL101-like [Pomacea canaliculata]|uniref:G-protein coupled receptor GRL101-like n=1 Tax=Pomacea canaliculata TaxID=400727 RepID=UPI000D7350B0|nr:G-protein coupled receptor GRL101-like [Pomacea canaliculata]
MFFCPESHFTCVSLQQVCLPVYLRCNGVNDCPGHEDEAACDRYTCPGFYRCRASQVCVHESHVCDGIYHCPLHDDEILCNETCPHSCVCHGWAFRCSGIFHAASYPNLRYVNASGTAMNLIDFESNIYLVHLILVRCNITRLHEVTLPNLRILDLSSNKLTHISSNLFTGLTRLDSLKLSFNPLNVLFFVDARKTSSLKFLDLSDVVISSLDLGNIFLSALTTLNLSGSGLDHVTGQGFEAARSLKLLDLRRCPMTIFPREIFYNLTKLQNVFADNYKLCCPVILPPGFNVLNCHSPSDEVSSCDDLLRSGVYRAGVAIFASLALLGNLSSLVYRLMLHKTSGNVGYDVFVTNLCVADFLMGLYLLIIGIADFRYRGSYVWEDVGWRNSSLCKLAGFTSLLSCEVSVFIIFLITVDRFLVLRFPFSQVHFGKRSAQCACAVSWLTGVALACVPLLPMTSHWQFYSQTSICVPLPTSRVHFPGREYAFGVMIIFKFNFIHSDSYWTGFDILVCSHQFYVCTKYIEVKKRGYYCQTSNHSSDVRLLVLVSCRLNGNPCVQRYPYIRRGQCGDRHFCSSY